MFDTTRMLANLVFTGRRAKFLVINSSSTYASGTLPYLFTRIQALAQAFGTGEGSQPVTVTTEPALTPA